MTEVRCSDEAEHRRRLERRQRGLGGFSEPTWESVQARRADFDDWHDERLVLDATWRGWMFSDEHDELGDVSEAAQDRLR